MVSPAESAEPAPCFAAFADAQKLAKTTQLRAARARFDACLADTTCPAPPLLADCAEQRRLTDARIGSVVIEAMDARSTPMTNVRVAIDGKLAAERLDGTAIDLDPGTHQIDIEAPGKRRAQRTVMVGEGQKLRAVSVTLEDLLSPATSAPPAEPAGAHRSMVPVYILGAVALVGFGIGGVLAVNGQSRIDGCPPAGCSASTIDDLRFERTVAWSGFGVGLASVIGAGVYLLLTGSHAPPARVDANR